MKFSAGALSATSMNLSDSTVGKYSDLTVELTTEHDIPIANGQINIDFPKWNPNAPIDKYQSYVDTATANVVVPCQPLDELSSVVEELECIFSTGDSLDQLTVTFVDPTNR